MRGEALLQELEACTLDPSTFHQAEHVEVAWLALRRDRVELAISKHCDALRRFLETIGSPGVYHATITWAFLLLIHERMAAQPAGASFNDFRAGNPDLFEKNVLSRWYTDETLRSPHARQQFVLPDRCDNPGFAASREGVVVGR